jgi:hypothetical protein
VSGLSFAGSDGSAIPTDPILNLIAGNYTLTVAGNGDHTASYGFRLSDLATATPITLGNPISGTLPSGDNTDMYQFSAQVGDQIAFNRQALDSSFAPYVRIIGPYGGVRYGGSFGNSGTLTIFTAGTYSVLIEGAINANGAVDYTFNVSSQGSTTVAPFSGTALTLGALTSGTISTAGQQDNYIFTITSPINVYFDSLTNTSNLTWSLTNPSHVQLTSRSFSASDGSSFGTSPPLLQLIVPGTYLLTVQGSGGTGTGSYNFRLSDIASASLITPGTPVSASLNPGNATNLYQFNANAGDQFYFDALSGGGYPNYWRLLDPYGRQVWSNWFGTPYNGNGTQTLASTGTYTLLVEGYITNTSPVSYSFNAQKVTNTTTALTLGSQVNSAITQAGQQNSYTFTLVNATQLYFDSLTYDSNLNWSLYGPRGLEASRQFSNSDSGNIGTDPVLNLIAGNYTLIVFGTSDHTAGYGFRLSDLANPPATITKTYDPTADFSYYLNPDGVWSYGYRTSATGSFTQYGTRGNFSGIDYWYLANAGGQPDLGKNTSGAVSGFVPAGAFIMHPGDTAALQSYVSDLRWTAPDAGTYSLNAAFTLVDTRSPDVTVSVVLNGTTLFTQNLTGTGASAATNSQISVNTGDTLDFIVANHGTAHDGQFTQLNVQLTTAHAMALTPGTVVNTALTPGNATDIYQFTAQAGDLYYFDALGSSGNGNLYWRLIDPYGQQVWANGFGKVPTQALPFSGKYTLLVEGYSSNVGPLAYSFNAQKVTNTTTALTLGSQVNGAITQAGQQNSYTFTLANASQLYFDSLTYDSSLTWTLSGPNGDEVGVRNFVNSDGTGIGSTNPVLNLLAGNYTLTVSGSGDHTGSYSFRLSDLASATPITLGTTFSGTLNPGNATNLYQFSGNAGDLFYFDRLSLSGNAYWRLIDPYGQQISYNNLVSGPGTLPSTGTFTLLIDGYIGNTSPVSYSINIQKVTNTTTALTLGSQVNGAITQAGQSNSYTFTLANASQLYFDSLTNDSSLSWTLTGPRGAEVSSRSFTGSDASSISNPVLNLIAGAYTLTVSASGDHTGSYSFRLSDLASATPIVLGNPISGTLPSGTNTDLYQFNAQAGDQVALNRQALNGGSPYWRLIDPYGEVTFAASFGNSGTLTLPLAGTYTLLFEGQINANGATNYTFNVSSQGHITITPLTGTALSLGSLVSGAIAAAGQQDTYVFTITNPANLYFDSLTNNGSLLWSLIGPQGATLVNSRGFSSSDGINFGSGSPILSLIVPGTYQVRVQGSGSATGSYNFRLSDLATATPITPGTVVSGTLTPGTATNIYQFNGNAGDLFYFDTLSGSYPNNWRLIDPYGQQVWSNYLYTSVPTQALASSGTYTLLVEGYIVNTSPVSYSFNAQKVTNTTAALTLGTQVSGAVTQAGQQNSYTFTLANASQLYFDSLTNDSSLYWNLYGPRGGVVSSRSFTSSDGINISSDPVLSLAAGSYTLSVFGSGDHTASYSFRLSDLATATPIAPGTVVSGTLTPGTATNIYQFNASAGDLYYFDILSGAGYPNNWRLIDPYGQQVWSSYFGTSYRFSGPQALPSTGTYTLLVEGYTGNTSPVSYSFSANSVPLAPPIQVTGLGLQPTPDLITTGLAVTANGPIQSGSLLTVTWYDANTGTFVTSSSWTDQVLVRDANDNIIASVTLPYDSSVSGPLAPGASSQRQVTLRLPNGNAGAGRLTFFVTVDALNNVVAELNNTSSLVVTSQLAPYPDLEVTGLSVDPIDDWTPGSTVTVHWNTLNAGNLATQGSWSELISVRDLSTGATLVLATIPYDGSAKGYGPLAPGASQSRQYSFTWPSGLSSTGDYEFAVTTNSLNTIFEANAAGTGETNNTEVVDIASAPDLQVKNLAVTSSPVQSGATVTLSWNDVNAGVAATPAGWYDHIVVVNTTTGEQLVDSAVFYDPTQPGNAPLASGQSLARSFTFALPDGKRGAGSLQISVTVNRDQNNVPSIIEAADGIDAAANNEASITVQSQEKAYPALTASNFVIPATGNGGDQVQIGWTVTNLGSVATTASQWVDRIVLNPSPTFGNANDVTLAKYTHTGSLAPGQSYTSSQTLTLPLQTDGTFYVTVETDAGGAVIEPDTLASTYAPAQQITITAPFADLSVPAVVAPATANSGDPINVSWRVTNSGDSTTSVSTWKDRIILSTGNVYNPATDMVLGDVVHTGALAPGVDYVGQASLQWCVWPIQCLGGHRHCRAGLREGPDPEQYWSIDRSDHHCPGANRRPRSR